MAPQEQVAMRRDVHRWFLLGLAFAGILTSIGAILLQSDTPVVVMIVGSWVALIGIVFNVRHRRVSAFAGRDIRFRSREMRCPWARDMRLRFSGSTGHASLR
jgi:hypothetical protein